MLTKEFEILKIAEAFCIENNKSKINVVEIYCLLEPRFSNYKGGTEKEWEIIVNFLQKDLPSLFPLFSIPLEEIKQSISIYKAKKDEGDNNE